MCRRFESEHEKVLPFYASSLTPEEQDQVELRAREPPSEELARVIIIIIIITIHFVTLHNPKVLQKPKDKTKYTKGNK